MDKPARREIMDAAATAMDEVSAAGYAQVFLDHDRGSDRAKITVGSSMRGWDGETARASCPEYTGRAMPLTTIFLHQLVEGDADFSMTVTADAITDALDDKWDVYVGYYTGSKELFPRHQADINWAARTASNIPDRRTISLWMDYVEGYDWCYFLWVTREIHRVNPSGSVKYVKDLVFLNGDRTVHHITARITQALRDYFEHADLNTDWSYHCPVHHYQYKHDGPRPDAPVET